MSKLATHIPVHIRWMIRHDMPEILAIEQTFDEPWEQEDFLIRLRQRNCIGMIAESVGKMPTRLLGYMMYELHKKHLNMLTLAVHPDYRRRGVGKQLIGKLKTKLGTPLGRSMIRFDVSERLLSAHHFLKKNDFLAIGVHRRMLGDDDGYRFEYRIEQEPYESDLEPCPYCGRWPHEGHADDCSI